MTDWEALKYQIGLTCIDGIGHINAKHLIAYCGSAKAVFEAKKGQLLKIPGIGSILAKSIVVNASNALRLAEGEVEFIQKHKITPLFYTDEAYPHRLKHCTDAPIMLYYKGNANLNATKVIGVVGTRCPSTEGVEQTVRFIKDLEQSGVIVVSGLAYGIDITAHKESLLHAIPTIGVLAHGLDRLYPEAHHYIAKKMINCGGLLTEFMSGTNPDAVNFPKRNRIVAGMIDALVVIESKRTGGSLITATIAQSYNKDVFAFPGRPGEPLAEGPNGLIKQNKASLIENAADLIYAMNWQQSRRIPEKEKGQTVMPLHLKPEEEIIARCFTSKSELHLDEISFLAEMPVSKAITNLLNLEFSHLIKSLPGKMYKWVA